MSKSGRNTHFPCAKHFFEVCIGFRATLGQFKMYKLDFEIFIFFGHPDIISSMGNHRFLDILHIENGEKIVFGLSEIRENAF